MMSSVAGPVPLTNVSFFGLFNRRGTCLFCGHCLFIFSARHNLPNSGERRCVRIKGWQNEQHEIDGGERVYRHQHMLMSGSVIDSGSLTRHTYRHPRRKRMRWRQSALGRLLRFFWSLLRPVGFSRLRLPWSVRYGTVCLRLLSSFEVQELKGDEVHLGDRDERSLSGAQKEATKIGGGV